MLYRRSGKRRKRTHLFAVCLEMRHKRFEIFLLDHFNLVRTLSNVAMSRRAGIADDLPETGCMGVRELTKRDEIGEVIREAFDVLVDELDRRREVLYRGEGS